jgi:hypothetical protein
MKYYVTVGSDSDCAIKYAAVALTQQLLDEVHRLRDIVVDNNLSEAKIETDAVTWASDDDTQLSDTQLCVYTHSVVFEVGVIGGGTVVTDNIPIKDFEAALALPADAEDETYINDDVFVFGGNIYNGIAPEEV